jgi:hypothetical protein
MTTSRKYSGKAMESIELVKNSPKNRKTYSAKKVNGIEKT